MTAQPSTPRAAPSNSDGSLLAVAAMSPAERAQQISMSLRLVAEKAKMAETHDIVTGKMMVPSPGPRQHLNQIAAVQDIAARLA